MRMYDILQKKRMGEPLTREEITFFVRGYTDGTIPDYQASAFTMAVCCRGMNEKETADLTEAMMHSGDTVDLSMFGDRSVDKHSTGGVGDKTTMILAPIVASLGGKVAKMTGRGLGHTGGTLDKLESIPGFRTTLTADEFISHIDKIGMAVIGQSGELAPADKKLYALRDVTATVDCIPLIASSIMSKKLAAGSHSIVLDVKVGSGAFMKTVEEGRTLARAMIDVGEACGRKVRALVTNMDAPLGMCIGNALEVKEAVAVLRGEQKDALYDICVELATNMISLSLSLPMEESRRQVVEAIDSGRAYAKMKEWIAAQGGDVAAIDDLTRLPTATILHEVKAPCDGYLAHMDTESVGISASLLGAGRIEKDDAIDYSAGIVLQKKTGDRISSGDVLAVLHTTDAGRIPAAEAKFLSALIYSDSPVAPEPTVHCIL